MQNQDQSEHWPTFHTCTNQLLFLNKIFTHLQIFLPLLLCFCFLSLPFPLIRTWTHSRKDLLTPAQVVTMGSQSDAVMFVSDIFPIHAGSSRYPFLYCFAVLLLKDLRRACAPGFRTTFIAGMGCTLSPLPIALQVTQWLLPWSFWVALPS